MEEEQFKKLITLGMRTYDLEITDTGKDQTIKEAHGFLLVYDISNRSSFEKIPELHNKICKAYAAAGDLSSTPPLPPAVLVVRNILNRNDEREVSTEHGRKEAERLGCEFREVTGNTNVEGVFLAVVQLGVQHASRDIGMTGEGGANSWFTYLESCFGIEPIS